MTQQQKDLIKALNDIPFKYNLSFEDYITIFTDWSTTKGFPDATAKSSIEKLKSEITEVEWCMFPGGFDNNLTEEYVDCLMCIFDSAKRAGVSTKELINTFKLKLEKNMSRTWKKNPDNTYSHI